MSCRHILGLLCFVKRRIREQSMMSSEFYYEVISSQMSKKHGLLGSKLANNTVKDIVLDEFGSFAALNTKAREKGNWYAKMVLSQVYEDDFPEFNAEKDSEKAIGCLESSIHDGNPLASALSKLASLYDTKGTLHFQRKAHQLYHKAAKMGAVEAELNLAESYMFGVEGVVNEDVQEAFKWYKKAADEEPFVSVEHDEDIHYNLMRGTCRKLCIDVKMKSLMRLFDNYVAGNCPERKPQPLKAIHYLKKAAVAGHTESQTRLGRVYLTGEAGARKDIEEAKRWLGKAANSGSIEAKEILKNFDRPGAIEEAQASEEKPAEQQVQQFCDILKSDFEKDNHHPYLMKAPLILNESMLKQYPDSPTAQIHLKAFKLAEKGFQKWEEGNFKEAVKLLACSYLCENTVIQSFPVTKIPTFRSEIIKKIFEELKINEKFFEGLVLLIPFYTVPVEPSSVSYESLKIDFKKTMFVKNVIHLIEKNKSSKSPSESTGNIEDNYKHWLGSLYYILGSLYTIKEWYDQGAQAFEKSITLCTTNYEAKAGLAFCLMNIYFLLKHEDVPKPKDQELTEREKFKYCTAAYDFVRVDSQSYLRWTVGALHKKAKQVFLDYITEAPVCDKKYPNCHYHLGYMYVLIEKNIQKALEWRKKGEDAEEKRLPFIEPVHTATKKFLMNLDMLPLPKETKVKRCSNGECSSQTIERLMTCPCKQVAYCGRDCQKKDWKQHKKICSKKNKEK